MSRSGDGSVIDLIIYHITIPRLTETSPDRVLSDVLKGVLDVSVSPDDIIAGSVSSRAVIVDRAEMLVALIHVVKVFHHLIKRIKEPGFLSALADIEISHLFSLPFIIIISSFEHRPGRSRLRPGADAACQLSG